MVALQPHAAVQAQPADLLGVLGALRDHVQLQGLGELDDGPHDRGALGVGEQVGDEGLVDLDLVDRQALEVREAGIAGAEIVDGELHAHALEPLEGVLDGVHVAQQHGLGELEVEQVGRQAGFRQGRLDAVEQVAAPELQDGEVHRHPDRMAEGEPGARLPAGLFQHPFADGDDQAAALGQGDEFHRRDGAELGVVPAQQGLEAEQAAMADVDLGLVVQRQLAVVQGVPEQPLQAHLLEGMLVRAGGAELEGVAPLVLGVVHGGVGFLEQEVEDLAVLGKHADPDAEADRHRVPIELEGLAERVDDPLRPRLDLAAPAHALQQGDELVAAVAPDRADAVRALPQAFDGADHELVAPLVPEHVVDLLEIVHPQEHQADHGVPRPRRLGGLLEALGELEAVGQVGQRIVVGQEGEPLDRRVVLGARAQRLDAEGQVGRQVLQQAHLLLVECPGLGGIDGQGAQDARLAEEGQGDARAETPSAGEGLPGLGPRAGAMVLDQHGPAVADGGAARPPARGHVGPWDPRRPRALVLEPLLRHGAHARRLARLRVADPGEAVIALAHEQAADVAEQAALVPGADHRHVAGAQQLERPVEAARPDLLGLVLAGQLARLAIGALAAGDQQPGDGGGEQAGGDPGQGDEARGRAPQPRLELGRRARGDHPGASDHVDAGIGLESRRPRGRPGPALIRQRVVQQGLGIGCVAIVDPEGERDAALAELPLGDPAHEARHPQDRMDPALEVALAVQRRVSVEWGVYRQVPQESRLWIGALAGGPGEPGDAAGPGQPALVARTLHRRAQPRIGEHVQAQDAAGGLVQGLEIEHGGMALAPARRMHGIRGEALGAGGALVGSGRIGREHDGIAQGPQAGVAVGQPHLAGIFVEFVGPHLVRGRHQGPGAPQHLLVAAQARPDVADQAVDARLEMRGGLGAVVVADDVAQAIGDAQADGQDQAGDQPWRPQQHGRGKRSGDGVHLATSSCMRRPCR